ncbi:hypothetical protein EDC04DRAFT_2602669 [Pisolithus marmoratus]|nr:hypothetical protein EDC04DRAFT_2602669 [Pisolithus marmoratus]
MSSSIPNPLDDATHEVLDQQVNELVGSIIEEPRDKDYLFLLQTIINCSNGTLDPMYDSHCALLVLLKSQPGLTTMLHAAWNSRRAFTVPYCGKAVDAFCQYLEQRNKKLDPHGPDRAPKYYDKFCSIIQSSGTGKSCLLVEVHPFVILSIQCLIYPIQLSKKDDVPAVILTGNLETTAADYGARCCAFFVAVFTTMCEHLSTRLASSSLEDSLKQWNDSCLHALWLMVLSLSSLHRQFFVTLKTKYETYYKLIKSDVFKDTVVEIAGKLGNLSLQGEQVEQMMEQASQLIEQREEVIKSPHGHKYMTSTYFEMTWSLGQLFDSGNRHKPKLVIALDEAHSLGVLRPYGYRPSTILCRVINIYSEVDRMTNHAVWVIFVSMDLKVADFAAPLALLFAVDYLAWQAIAAVIMRQGTTQMMNVILELHDNATYILNKFSPPDGGSLSIEAPECADDPTRKTCGDPITNGLQMVIRGDPCIWTGNETILNILDPPNAQTKYPTSGSCMPTQTHSAYHAHVAPMWPPQALSASIKTSYFHCGRILDSTKWLQKLITGYLLTAAVSTANMGQNGKTANLVCQNYLETTSGIILGPSETNADMAGPRQTCEMSVVFQMGGSKGNPSGVLKTPTGHMGYPHI